MIDLSLAFDCIETSKILPEKLKHYGADQTTTRFFKEFFTGRKHQTEWNGAISETQNLSNHSCVQGSCLGAPIYNLYTKDLQKVCKSTIINFADDTNIIVTSKNPNNLIEKANEELKSISDYMSANYLLINTKKTQALLFKPKTTPKNDHNTNLTLNGTKIDIVQNAKYLGITIDNKLKFKDQYKSLLKKLKNATRSLISTRKFLNTRTKLSIYNALFKSNLEYGSITYQDKLNNDQLNKLTKLQKICLRLIYNARPNSHTINLYKKSKIIPVNETFNTESIKFVFKNTNELYKSKQPKVINELINKKPKNSKQTRLSQNTNMIPLHTKQAGSLLYSITKQWNNLPNDLKNAGNYKRLMMDLICYAQRKLVPCSILNCKICQISINPQLMY